MRQRRALGVHDRVDLRHLLAERDVERGGEQVGDRERDRPAATPWRDHVAERVLEQTARSAGSPRKPMPSEAIVMPSWQAERYSSIWSICLSASAAPRLPSSRICSMRDWRARTSANSAATKKPLAATSTSHAEEEQQLGHEEAPRPRKAALRRLLRGRSSSLIGEAGESSRGLRQGRRCSPRARNRSP